jgi:hypothetical protein
MLGPPTTFTSNYGARLKLEQLQNYTGLSVLNERDRSKRESSLLLTNQRVTRQSKDGGTVQEIDSEKLQCGLDWSNLIIGKKKPSMMPNSPLLFCDVA